MVLADSLRDSLRCGQRGCHAPRSNLHCPAHRDSTPSLSLTRKGSLLLIHCFGGCSQSTVIGALRRRGLWDSSSTRNHRVTKVAKPANPAVHVDITSLILSIWRSAIPAAGTSVERYLAARGLPGSVPPSLRFTSRLAHTPTGTLKPCMVAAVQSWPEDKVCAIHRTYLNSEGSAKADVEPARMVLGPIRGGGVRLAAAGPVLAVAEGIETALSVQLATSVPAWAALSASNLPNLVLPPLPMAGEVIIAADADPAGTRGAYEAAERWTREGRRVRIAVPPGGLDFNDVIRGAR